MAVPELARSEAVIAAVTWVELTTVVGREDPLKKTTAPFTKLIPLTVKLNAPEFCFAENGVNDVISGAGLPMAIVMATDWLFRKDWFPRYAATIVCLPRDKELTVN